MFPLTALQLSRRIENWTAVVAPLKAQLSL